MATIQFDRFLVHISEMFFAKDLVCSWRHVWADQSWSVIITVIHSMTGLVLNLQWQGKYVEQVNKYCSCPVFMHAIQPKMTKTCKKYTMRFAGLKDEGFKNAVCVIAKFWCNMVMNLRHFARYICIICSPTVGKPICIVCPLSFSHFLQS